MSYGPTRLVTGLVLASFVVATASAAAADPLVGVTVRVVPPLRGGDTTSLTPDVSKDGRYVVFDSGADGIVPGDTNGSHDVFVTDTTTGAVSAVSVPTGGGAPVGGTGGWSWGGPRITSDGRYVAFTADSDTLVAGDTNDVEDGYVRDLREGTTTRVTLGRGGVQGDAPAVDPVVSDNGRYVVFESGSSNVVPGFSTGLVGHTYRRDLRTGTVVAVDVKPDGKADPAGGSWGGSDMSADGRYVVFTSSSPVLSDTKFATSGLSRVYRRDLTTGITKAVSPAGATGHSRAARVSTDGRYVAYNQFVAADWHVFVWDAATGKNTQVDTRSTGGTPRDESAGEPTISADGRYVAFAHEDSLDRAPTAHGQVYVKDRSTGSVRLASVSPSGQPGNALSHTAAITPDGRSVAFVSEADNLVAGDIEEPNSPGEVFLRRGQ